MKLLRDAARARYMAPRPVTDIERPPIGRGAVGCLMRFVLIGVLLFLALLVALFMFGSSLLQGF